MSVLINGSVPSGRLYIFNCKKIKYNCSFFKYLLQSYGESWTFTTPCSLSGNDTWCGKCCILCMIKVLMKVLANLRRRVNMPLRWCAAVWVSSACTLSFCISHWRSRITLRKKSRCDRGLSGIKLCAISWMMMLFQKLNFIERYSCLKDTFYLICCCLYIALCLSIKLLN